MKKQKEIIEPIGYFIQDNNFIFCNPCTVPIELLEDSIKKHKEKKHKKGEVTVCCTIIIPNIFKHGKRNKRTS